MGQHVKNPVDDIRSGVMDMRSTVTPASEPPFGFAIRGSFSLGAGDLRADLRYTQVVGTRRRRCGTSRSTAGRYRGSVRLRRTDAFRLLRRLSRSGDGTNGCGGDRSTD
jgi:hypothetical protein